MHWYTRKEAIEEEDNEDIKDPKAKAKDPKDGKAKAKEDVKDPKVKKDTKTKSKEDVKGANKSKEDIKSTEDLKAKEASKTKSKEDVKNPKTENENVKAIEDPETDIKVMEESIDEDAKAGVDDEDQEESPPEPQTNYNCVLYGLPHLYLNVQQP